MNRFNLAEMSWEEVEQLVETAHPVVLLPAGSVEQHGRHLPLGTDTYTALDVAREAGRRAEGVVVAPPVWYGMSAHHMQLAGTVTVRPEVLTELFYDVIESLAAHGFNRFVLVNGHRVANLPWMQLVCGRVHQQLAGCRAALFDLAYMSQNAAGALDFEHLGHADEIETSHMLAAHPQLCRMQRAVDNPHRSTRFEDPDPRRQGDRLVYFPGPADETETRLRQSGGVRGTPTRADEKRGQRYRSHLIQRLLQVIGQMRKKGDDDS